MVNMYEVVEYLCGKNNVSIAQMCRETGIRQSVFTELKYGRTRNLSLKNMVKVANYFGVSTDVFNGGMSIENPGKVITEIAHTIAVAATKKDPVAQNDEVSDDAIKFALFGGTCTDAQYEEVKQFARFIKERDARDTK